MTRSDRTHLRIVAAVCIVVLGMFIPTLAPLANPGSNLTPGLHPLTYAPSNNESGEENILDAASPTIWLANPSQTVRGFNICLQDDNSLDTLQINSRTGAYKYTRCSDGRLLTGTGTVTSNGCIVTLQHFSGPRRLSAEVDTCLHKGRASVQVGATVGDLDVIITDSNTANNTCDCTVPLPPPNAEDNFFVDKMAFLEDGSDTFVIVPLGVATLRSQTSITSSLILLVDNQIIGQRCTFC